MTTLEPQVEQAAGAPAWRDKKRRLWLMGLIAPTALFVMLPLVWALNRLGWHAAAQAPLWIGPILLYVLLPILDLRFGPD
ncbi:alkane 1-monooxygenase, partial [Mycobacterium kansasii]